MSEEMTLARARCAQDHQELFQSWERALVAAEGPARVVLLSQLAALSRDWLLDGILSLRYFQEALQLGGDVALMAPARSLYRSLGRLSSVELLLRLELDSGASGADRAHLERELGDVVMDQGRLRESAECYARAVTGGEPAGFLLEDAQVAEAEWPVQVGRLLQQAAAAGDELEKTETFLRAAGIAAGFSMGEARQLWRRAYEANPLDERAVGVFEGLFIESDRPGELMVIQQALLEKETDDLGRRGRLAYAFGLRWALRRQPDKAVSFLLTALRANVDHLPAVTYLSQVSRADPLDEVIVALAEELSDRFSSDMGSGPKAGVGLSYLLASAALVAARDLNNIVRARSLGERLSQVDPSHPALGQLFDRSDSTGN